MSDELTIRESTEGDIAAIELLYPAAFPDEDLLPVVRDLLQGSTSVLSLVATIDSQIAGHVIFTNCGVVGQNVKVELLAPLAVTPARQRQGVGSAVVLAGLQRLRDAGVDLVCVLGDPAYYGRFGFVQESLVEPPYPLPAEWAGAWQSLSLDENGTPSAGKLSVPSPWLQPALWAP